MKRRPGILLIGGSAGSMDAVLRIVPHLTVDVGIPIVIIMHRKNSGDDILRDLLAARTSLPVKEADEKEIMRPGTLYTAPADYHLLMESNFSFSLDASEKVNYSRPSIDVTFESAANVFQGGTIGILLSGANADGVEGLRKIKAGGGMIAVQDPASAAVPYMPQRAISSLPVDLILSNDQLGHLQEHIRVFLGD